MTPHDFRPQFGRLNSSGLQVCTECGRTRSTHGVREPEWLRRMREQGLPAKDMTKVAA